jgi:GNAT superfamily N-acetyltransferase
MPDTREHSWVETLRDGLAVTIRELRADDRERMAAAVRALDRESIYFRFFSYRSELTEQGLDRIMAVDPAHDFALVVATGAGGDEIIIGAGRYVGAGPGPDGTVTAEVAFTVEEDYHGLGIAGRMLARLAEVARKRGVTAFEADVLTENKGMLRVFARTGWPIRTRNDGTSVHVVMPLLDQRP